MTVKTYVFILTSLVCQLSFGYIPRGLLILQKTAENNGTGAYVIEQEVQFQTESEPLVLRETWVVENENSMKLTVTGTKELKDQLRFQYIYSGGQRTSLLGGSKQTKKISEDFFEKYFHVRSGESFANHLVQMHVVPGSILIKKVGKTSKDFEYQPENYLRLSRVGGNISYAFGTPSTADSTDNSPGLWIEQDQFVLRKLRLVDGSEVAAERFIQYARGLNFPRKRTVRWGNNLVQLSTLTVSAKATGGLGALEPSRMDALETLPNKNLVQEFYNRYR
jgi:hypothetical protein